MENVFNDDKIMKLVHFCFTNKIDFIYQKEENGNYIKISEEPKMNVVLNIEDPKDENLYKMIDEKLVELTQLLQK
jgi:hypothetical protein